MSQGILPLSLPPVFSAENFYVSTSNEQAFALIDSWPNWQGHVLIIHGEKGTGKTHLGHIWAQRAKAGTVEAYDMHEYTPTPGNRLIENIEQLASQEALLHAYNHMRESGDFLLLTSALAPSALNFALADLTSRLIASPQVGIAPPGDDMLAAALRKQFADRQLKVDNEVVDYLLPRMERTLAGVHALVEMLDKQALLQQRRLSIPFIRRVLDASAS